VPTGAVGLTTSSTTLAELLVWFGRALGLRQPRDEDPHELRRRLGASLDRAFARWCFTVECDRPRRWAAAFSNPAARTAATTTTSRSVARSGPRVRRSRSVRAVFWRQSSGPRIAAACPQAPQMTLKWPQFTKKGEIRADPGLPGAGTPDRRAARGPPPPPALRALVAGAAGRLPSRGRVAVDDVRGDEVGRGDDDGAAPVRAGHGEQGYEQRPSPLVLCVVPARLSGGAPTLALAAGCARHDAGRRVSVVARADHAAPPERREAPPAMALLGWGLRHRVGGAVPAASLDGEHRRVQVCLAFGDSTTSASRSPTSTP
jgi:hypothetical protein